MLAPKNNTSFAACDRVEDRDDHVCTSLARHQERYTGVGGPYPPSRSRTDPGAPEGTRDCTSTQHTWMSRARWQRSRTSPLHCLSLRLQPPPSLPWRPLPGGGGGPRLCKSAHSPDWQTGGGGRPTATAGLRPLTLRRGQETDTHARRLTLVDGRRPPPLLWQATRPSGGTGPRARPRPRGRGRPGRGRRRGTEGATSARGGAHVAGISEGRAADGGGGGAPRRRRAGSAARRSAGRLARRPASSARGPSPSLALLSLFPLAPSSELTLVFGMLPQE